MASKWQQKDTDTHQDHVIAHVVGATVLGYFVFDEALHLMLDMGFIWTIYLDAQMSLLPQMVAIDELEADTSIKSELKDDAELLLRDGLNSSGLAQMTLAPIACLIEDVELFESDEGSRLVINGTVGKLTIETTMLTREFALTT